MSVPVVRIITRLNIGGPSIQAATLTERLEARGFHTHLIHGRLDEGEGDMRYLLRPDAPNVLYLGELQRPLAPLADARAFWRIFRLLCRTRPSVVHTHMAKAGAVGRLAASLYNRTAGRGKPARVVHTYHGHVLEGYFGPAKATAFIQAERVLARVTDAIVAISPAIHDDLLQHFRIGHAEQYRVIPLGFDLSAFAALDAPARQAARRALDIPVNAPVISTVGRLTPIKRHDVLLDSVAAIRPAYPDLVVLVAGDGELRAALESTAERRGIRPRLRFLGWRRDLATIYAATDVFVLTSDNEGTPVALIEAMASGVPGVSTAVGGVRDVIGGEDLSLLAPAGDAPAIAAGVQRLLRDPAARRAMGERARAHVLARYTLDRLVRDVAALYDDLLGRSRTSG